ncbi:MAG: bifunctional (p)ppGpp synthetase/guanosine-3',5'-bis(diphosphate) 3'-pyrophosphohydrolase [Steroidobacteraceae bacterium]
MDSASFFGFLPTGRRALGVPQLFNKLEDYLPPDQVEQIREAYEFGASAHQGQKRASGEPYISHPVAVATLLADLYMDGQTIIAAILHDVIEDTPTLKDDIAEKFGAEVAEIVDGVSKLDQLQFKSRAEAQAESFRKMLLAMVRDIRVIMVKLADRTHNMRTLGAMPPAKRRAIAKETLDIYAPIANRLGIYSIKNELEDIGLKTLYPNRYKVIEKAVKIARGNQKQFLSKIKTAIEAALTKAGIQGRVEGREKHPFSIYQKMKRKRTSLAEIVDVFGFRIVVDSVDTCYRCLGLIHSLYRPMPGRFKDYIAIPRVNGYQSLHTTLFGPNGMPIEVQLRTVAMQQIAESGVAAHWQYKSGDTEDNRAGHDRARDWLQHLVGMHGGNSEEFLESVKVDLFPDKVYVFTPKGDIRRLPRGATPVDFAYAVHTDIGNRCVAAKIDRRLVPLRTPLRNGQTVEIITAKGAMPNPTWANFVVTAKARASVRQYLKGMRQGEAAELGKRMLSQSLSELNLSFKQITEPQLTQLAHELQLSNANELLEKIGMGERLAPLVARRLLPSDNATHHVPVDGSPLAIAGAEGLSVSYARCCFPIPNDPIMAYVTSGHGIVIHRERCGNLKSYRKQPDKWLSVVWQSAPDKLFACEIRLQVKTRIGILAAVASEISATHTNIEKVSIIDNDGGVGIETFELQVSDRRQLAQVIKRLRKMPDVVSVTRTLT